MRSENIKEYRWLVIVLLLVTVFGLYVSLHGSKVTIKEAANKVLLPESDFVIDTGHGQLIVGKTSYGEVKQLYPQGDDLGKSTVYHPQNQPLYLTMSKKGTTLIAVHIQGGSLTTARGIKVSDSLEKLLAAYGSDYKSVSTGEAGNVDMVYGQSNSIVFQVRSNQVNAIILQHAEVSAPAK